MKIFYEKLSDGTIGRSSNSETVAQHFGLAYSSKEEIVRGYDGKLYLKSECPVPPEKITIGKKLAELEAQYNLPRPVRTALLLARAAGQSVNAELMARVDEIEALAVPLRQRTEGTL